MFSVIFVSRGFRRMRSFEHTGIVLSLHKLQEFLSRASDISSRDFQSKPEVNWFVNINIS